MKAKLFLLSFLIVFGLALPAFAGDKKETAFERVLRTGAIRCGYGDWYPIFMTDPNTGEFSGIFYEYSEALGKALDLKIEWVGPIGWGDFPAALRARRIDAMCTGIWPSGTRAKVMDFTQPIYYLPFYAFVRADDRRFDNNLNLLNDERYTLTMSDGEMSSEAAYKYFPKSSKVELPQFSDVSVNFMNVADGKADAYLNDSVSYYEFNDKNPGRLKIVPAAYPVSVVGNTLAILKDEDAFRRMLDYTTLQLINDGTVETILRKYERYPGSLMRVAKPYELGEGKGE